MSRVWRWLNRPVGEALGSRRAAPPAPGPPAGPPSDVFEFRDEPHARVDSGPQFCKYRPQPGSAIVELLDADGVLVAVYTFAVKPAPRVTVIDGVPGTLVVAPSGRSHQEITLPAERLPSLGIPFQKPNAAIARLWWSCEYA